MVDTWYLVVLFFWFKYLVVLICQGTIMLLYIKVLNFNKYPWNDVRLNWYEISTGTCPFSQKIKNRYLASGMDPGGAQGCPAPGFNFFFYYNYYIFYFYRWASLTQIIIIKHKNLTKIIKTFIRSYSNICTVWSVSSLF